jgi:cell division protein FtsB
MKEKELLLDTFSDLDTQENIPPKYLYITLAFMVIMLLILGPKIYLTNNIYYESIKFNKNYNEYNTLKEENAILRQKLEKLKFELSSNDIDF